MWADFHFLRPWWLCLLLPAALLLWQIMRRESGAQAWARVIAPSLLPYLLHSEQKQGWLRPALLLGVIWFLGIFALSGPTFRRQPSPFAEDKVAVVLVIECTESMMTPDIQPTRLARAGQKVEDFLALRPGIEGALIAYSGSAHRVMPFSSDAKILASFARELDPRIMPVPGDAMAAALALANEELRRLGKPGAILLMTDGIEKGQLTEASRKRGAPVHILAMGAELDRPALQQAARALGGSLVVVSPDKSDVETLAGRVETSYASLGDSSAGERWEEAGYWLVLLLLLPASFWFRRGWTVRHD